LVPATASVKSKRHRHDTPVVDVPRLSAANASEVACLLCAYSAEHLRFTREFWRIMTFTISLNKFSYFDIWKILGNNTYFASCHTGTAGVRARCVQLNLERGTKCPEIPVPIPLTSGKRFGQRLSRVGQASGPYQ